MEALRQNARLIVDDARRPVVSPYEEWTSDELRDLLVQYRVPMRDSANATHETLVRVCDAVFGVDDLENGDGGVGGDGAAQENARELAESQRRQVRQYTMEELARMERAVRTIQKAYIARKAERRQREQILRYQRLREGHRGREGQRVECYVPEDPEGGVDRYDGECYDEFAEIDYSATEQDVPPHCRQLADDAAGRESFRRQSVLRRINERGDDYDEEIEVPWRKPSWKFAKRFEAANRPHRSGRGMKAYDWRTATSGRHCYAGGCGEQLDLWNEGRTSEFSQFGSGITNYFKVRLHLPSRTPPPPPSRRYVQNLPSPSHSFGFDQNQFLKWCTWVMFVLSILHLPILFVNTLGANDKMGLVLSAAVTTFGNLGSASDVGSVDIPGCDEMEFQFSHCTIGKKRTTCWRLRTPFGLFRPTPFYGGRSHIYYWHATINFRQEQARGDVRLRGRRRNGLLHPSMAVAAQVRGKRIEGPEQVHGHRVRLYHPTQVHSRGHH